MRLRMGVYRESQIRDVPELSRQRESRRHGGTAMNIQFINNLLATVCWVIAIVTFLAAMAGVTPELESIRVIALMAVSMIGLDKLEQ